MQYIITAGSLDLVKRNTSMVMQMSLVFPKLAKHYLCRAVNALISLLRTMVHLKFVVPSLYFAVASC